MTTASNSKSIQPRGLGHIIWFFLDNPLITVLFLGGLIFAGIYVLPFGLPPIDRHIDRKPVPVDAIPNIGENQQIVFTEWPGRSPQDVEDQVTYPLAVSLQGIPGVKSIRSYSMLGFSSIYIIFEDDIEFYWSRSRVLERLSVAGQALPTGVKPVLGPDATALGQIYWYTLEGEGFDLQELRTIQDWYVRYALQATPGVSEVASVGGYVKEYQIDVDPAAMREYEVSLMDVFNAVKKSNIDVGAKTIENNGVEYVIRGIGFIKSVQDLEKIVVKEVDNVPIYAGQLGHITTGPAFRRGALDKQGAEVVGGVAVVRFGENPLKVIEALKKQIATIAPGLPQKKLKNGEVSQVKIVPFYDRTKLIHETLDTLSSALIDQVLITIVVILLFMFHFRSSLVVSLSLPLGVLVAFIFMKIFGVDSNIMSLSGIAIAIGTMVDMGIIMTENIATQLEESDGEKPPLHVIFDAAYEVAGAILTAISTTIISFLPIFFMQGSEGKLFTPLAFTKTFALFGSVLVAIFLNPFFCYLLLASKESKKWQDYAKTGLYLVAVALGTYIQFWFGLILALFGVYRIAESKLAPQYREKLPYFLNTAIIATVIYLLAFRLMPLGKTTYVVLNFAVLGLMIASVYGLFRWVIRHYGAILGWLLDHKKTFVAFPTVLVMWGLLSWQGFDKIFFPLFSSVGLEQVRSTSPWQWVGKKFPGLGEEFMPDLDEGSFLFMPTTMPHGSLGEVLDIMQKQDIRLQNIPEVTQVVGKLGRVESPLDPAPVSMIETIIQYKSKYKWEDGRWVRQWRSHIETKDDIWKEILKATEVTGATSAPKLQPISTRLVMLQTGMRAPMGIKVKGKDLREIEKVGFQLEKYLKELPGVEASAVNADRIIGKPYLEFHIDRDKIARYGVNIRDVQNIIEIAIGGKTITTTVEGRERYSVRVRYKRELRDNIPAMREILVPARRSAQIPISQVADIKYVRGPQVIKSEDTFLVGYVLFDKKKGYSEVEVVEQAQRYLKQKMDEGKLVLPGGTSYEFAGSYKNQVRASKRLAVLIPIAVAIIFLLIYLQFRSILLTSVIFLAVPVAISGGFIMLWLYSQEWFLNFTFLGISPREMFQVQTYNLSVAVWVGFIALFGIAVDDSVVMGTYLQQSFDANKVNSREAIREAVIEAGSRRIRPCLMTTATTVLALMPILMSTGKGADVMIPMAIPTVGGMTFALLTVFVVPVVYSWIKEFKWDHQMEDPHLVGHIPEKTNETDETNESDQSKEKGEDQ